MPRSSTQPAQRCRPRLPNRRPTQGDEVGTVDTLLDMEELEPNYAHADHLVLAALRRRSGPSADLDVHRGEPGLPLRDLVTDDGGSYSGGVDASHFGKVPRLLMFLVYELDINDEGIRRPRDLPVKAMYVVDAYAPVTTGGRTGFLAVRANDGPPVLVPLPELPETLLDGTGTVADTREGVRRIAEQIAGLVDSALPTARTLAACEPKDP